MKRRVAVAAGIVAAAIITFAAHAWVGARNKVLVASGTLEARNIEVGSKVGGRVTQVLVREGDHVEPGQLLITFDEAELAAQKAQAQGRLEQARAALKKLEHGSRVEEIAQARATTATNQRAVAQAGAELKRAQTDALNAERTFRRLDGLLEQGAVSRQSRDDAEARMEAAQAQMHALASAVEVAQERLRAARAQQELVERGPRAEDIEAARADLHRAQGELALAEARWAEREVRSPASAVVEVLDLRPGDLIAAGAPVANLLEADQLYVMVYVPQTQVGRVQLGQRGEVRVDAFPDETFSATVEQIRQKAEFLPRNVQTAEEREHQVFGVKLRVDNPTRKLRAGVQADVRFVEAP
jgi:multidrug resistance efflux pump